MYNSNPDPNRPRASESWIEISSRPSNSSLSSAAEDIVPTNLSAQHTTLVTRRRRRNPGNSTFPLSLGAGSGHNATNGGNSSQEEYEESESESDRVMTSSNEGLGTRFTSDGRLREEKDDEEDEDEDYDEYGDDDNDEEEVATALGTHTDPRCFTPQPNAFTHPPSSTRAHDSVPGSYFPPMRRTSSPQRHSHPASQRQSRNQHHSPYNAISPNHQAHHDAALRASLTTLLSCAAAARNLSRKQSSYGDNTATGAPSRRVEATSLRLVPESVALGSPTQEQEVGRPRRLSASTPASASPSTSNRDSSPAIQTTHSSGAQQAHDQKQLRQLQLHQQSMEKNKRKATSATGSGAARSNSKDRRAVKKPRRLIPATSPSNIADVSPTLLTWVVSAGVLVFVSALSFSAGYATGREAGRMEAGSGIGSAREIGDTTRSCAKEAGTGVGRGLRRLRWGSTASGVRA